MHELVRTNNAVLITAIEALLKGAEIPHVVLDRHMSVLEGSLGILPRRILVDDENWDMARQLLEDAGLAHELRPENTGPKVEMTDDAVLGGRLRLKQKKKGLKDLNKKKSKEMKPQRVKFKNNLMNKRLKNVQIKLLRMRKKPNEYMMKSINC